MDHCQNFIKGRILPMKTMEEFNAKGEAMERLLYNRYLYKFTGNWLWLPITDSQTEGSGWIISLRRGWCMTFLGPGVNLVEGWRKTCLF